ncbi:hypothetical protein BYT27DRAFT_6470384 [Phlegmacium glaucopus]|nr:hypothetical protein BYT27DRAFT_6470384 [Phlegmacium glaucopus]
MYATQSGLIFKFIFDSRKLTYIRDIQMTREKALIYAIDALPFYLSNADYTPELARHAIRLLSYEFGANDDELHSALKVLHEAIELYLKFHRKYL